ncbi:hypothetical protein [Methylobacterium bullatum]|uniref:Uncharacterized protein n=1 Tax=Methylobacterium bullatum TaxID=570505 RepID=A0AAV4ZD59_9HYPH|nr:hypothetical protein [Methylobacterium bullatum]GJD41930.1 hypothetical protein OICFNHDK_4414 [Methylobacterium bullatum]
MKPKPKLTFKQLLDMLNDNAMDALVCCRNQYGDSRRQRENNVYETVGFLSAYVADVRNSNVLEDELYNHECWTSYGYKPKRGEVTRTAVRFVLCNYRTHTPLYEKARVYSKVIDYYLAKNMTPADIVVQLREEKLAGVLENLKQEDRLNKYDVDEAQDDESDKRPRSSPKGSGQGDDSVSTTDAKAEEPGPDDGAVQGTNRNEDHNNNNPGADETTGADDDTVGEEPNSYVVIDGNKHVFDPKRQIIVDADEFTQKILQWPLRRVLPFFFENRGCRDGLTVIGVIRPDEEDEE